mmetsp:Transcript_3506/g.7510  ORF Transcript_3506/g.7510 Transcript_3506/m.7510 type:complete len:80 (-) Transcript_3506:1029-1268(-)
MTASGDVKKVWPTSSFLLAWLLLDVEKGNDAVYPPIPKIHCERTCDSMQISSDVWRTQPLQEETFDRTQLFQDQGGTPP